MHNNYVFYGTKTKADEVIEFVNHVIETNTDLEAKARKKTPICIWGRHGIGKTEIVEAIAKERGFQFSYIAPAQFEEMGDLVGMPSVEGDKTVFKAPSWVPTQEGPGILLIDDVNRADERILRGIMQLLQNFELISWKLPLKWHIVLTANPDGGDYSVTPMDDAMLTRMLHISMEFDVKEWAKWAEKAGIDPRGINFVLLYPEIVEGNRTTPRTLVQFFETIRPIDNLYEKISLVRMLADSCLDENTVTAFISFVNNNLGQLIKPEEICNANNFNREVLEPFKSVVLKEPIRVDIIATLCTRLVNYLTVNKISPDKKQIENIKSFIKIDFIPNDIRLTMAQDLVSSGNIALKSIMADPSIAQLLLKRM
ncbi:MAG: AAA family ATPase [Emticicia sp.]|uniref:AAA family ATPase n=1 Tax=Emticicia sp. TaxID=1930953 RepID=UPI003BA79584